MSADIVNLRRVRKAKARQAKEQNAEANRQKYGRTRAERAQLEAEDALARRRLDASSLSDLKAKTSSDKDDA
jgi:hypothetical protein